mgnify:CR=1 FL=1
MGLQQFFPLPEAPDSLDRTPEWHEYNPDLRAEANHRAVQDMLNLFSFKCGLGCHRYSFELGKAATRALEAEDAIYYHYGMEPPPITESPALANLLAAGARQTAGTWQNLTATTANTVSGAFERALDAAWGKVATGAFDYKTAVKQAVDSLAQDLPMVTYPTGHTDSIEVAARRAVLTGVNQTAGKLQEARMDQMGAEFVETSAHGGARPSHAAWQGRRFHRGGAVDYLGVHYPDFAAATGYGTGAGLCGWNCRHSFFVVFPQLGDPPAWTREELADLNARNVEYNGKLYTRYEISQMQRARERNVRRWKKRYLAEDAAGLDPTDAAVGLRAARQSLADFTKATGGRADSARGTVPGFGRSEASKASYIVQKQTRFDAANKELQQMREASTIKAKGKLIESPPAPNEINFASEHVLQRWAERGMGPMDAERIIRTSKIAMSQRNGTQTCYYSECGFVAIGQDGNVASIGPLDEGGKKLMEVVRKHGIPH